MLCQHLSSEGEPVEIRRLQIQGAFEVTPKQHGDDRGVFLEWFRHDRFERETGHDLALAQANCSVSARGVVRGVHYADVPPGQAKYVSCVDGSVFDVVVDLRVGSPTYGQWDGIVLDQHARRAVYTGEGLGHGFMALSEGATVVYLCSTEYDPTREHEVNAFDDDLGIDWPTSDPEGAPLEPRLSIKDREAPTLAASRAAGVLPDFDAVTNYMQELRAHHRADRRT
jgi:dTDP-4-dehydrorhamnose 3,5-epimerase